MQRDRHRAPPAHFGHSPGSPRPSSDLIAHFQGWRSSGERMPSGLPLRPRADPSTRQRGAQGRAPMGPHPRPTARRPGSDTASLSRCGHARVCCAARRAARRALVSGVFVGAPRSADPLGTHRSNAPQGPTLHPTGRPAGVAPSPDKKKTTLSGRTFLEANRGPRARPDLPQAALNRLPHTGQSKDGGSTQTGGGPAQPARSLVMGAQISSSPPNAPPAPGPQAHVHQHTRQSSRFLLQMPVPPGGRRGQKGGAAGAGQARTARGGSLASCQQTRETGRRTAVSSRAAARPCSRHPPEDRTRRDCPGSALETAPHPHRGVTLHRRPQDVPVTPRSQRGFERPSEQRRPDRAEAATQRGPRVAREGPEKASLQTQREISSGRGPVGTARDC